MEREAKQNTVSLNFELTKHAFIIMRNTQNMNIGKCIQCFLSILQIHEVPKYLIRKGGKLKHHLTKTKYYRINGREKSPHKFSTMVF